MGACFFKSLFAPGERTPGENTDRAEPVNPAKHRKERVAIRGGLCYLAVRTLIISRPKNENVVLLSEYEYNEMMKAKRNADYLAMIDKSMTEAEAGGFITKTIAELY